jgi:hypothetical protein
MRFLLLIAASCVLLVSCGGSKPETTSAPVAPGAVTASMTRTDTTARFFVDQIGTTSNPAPDKEIIIPAAGSLIISGWAADLAGDPVSGVEISIDQKLYSATYGMERPDVAISLKDPSYKNSGFQFSIQASQLSTGTHTITVRFINKMRSSYFETPAFHVRVQ